MACVRERLSDGGKRALRNREAARLFALAPSGGARTRWTRLFIHTTHTRALSLDPLPPDAHDNMGVIARQRNKRAAA